MLDPVLNHHFQSFKTAFEIAPKCVKDKFDNRQESSAFEMFVNYVLFSLDYPDIFTANLDLLEFVGVGGGSDTGLDGIGIKINERIVRNIEEVVEIAESARKINVEFVFIQSKMGSAFNLSEFNKFGLGVKNFFSKGYLPESSRIKEIRDIKDYIYTDPKVISKLDRNPSLYLFYVTTGIDPADDQNYIGSRSILKEELARGEVFFDKIDIYGIGGKQLIKSCRELENKFEVQININDIFPLIVDLEEDIDKAYTFTCSALEFLKILTKEDGTIRHSLFDDNVRAYLGTRGPVNSEIEETVLKTPKMFLICNNGITIVCSNFEQIRDKLVKIENPQIVNGCQTSHSIFNLKDHKNIGQVQLLIRVISTESIDISNKIVRGTNKQNQVLDEAFEAILPFHQEILEPFFFAFEKGTKIYYERRSKQYNSDPLIKKTQIVNLRILTQNFVAIFLESPHEAHRHEAKLLEKYAADIETRKIFKESHSPYVYYLCALIWYVFEKLFRENRIEKKYFPYKAHLYLLFRYSLGEYPVGLDRVKKVENFCEKLLQHANEFENSSNYYSIFEVFDTTQEKWLSLGKSKYGIKESNEFTELLINEAREKYLAKTKPVKIEESVISKEGEILNLIFKHGVWFGFIKRGPQYDNLYFDSRGYKGEVRELLPQQKVKFLTGNGPRGEYAYEVEIIE